jgi:uncharacterized membrane protein
MRLARVGLLLSAFAVVTFAIADPVRAQVRYEVTPLGPIHPTAINAHGQASGYMGAQPSDYHAALWLPAPAYGFGAGVNDLGTLSVPTRNGAATGAIASDINDLGQIAGTAGNSGSATTAMLWLPVPAYGRPAGWSVVNEPAAIGGHTFAQAINNSGQVVGFGTSGSFTWSPVAANGLPQGVNTLAGLTDSSSRTMDINEVGQITGTYAAQTQPLAYVPYLYLPTAAYGRPAGINRIPTAVPTPPEYIYAYGTAMNDRGQVVGVTLIDNTMTGGRRSGRFLWLPEADPVHGRPAGFVALGPSGTDFTPVDINNAGYVLGARGLWDPATGQVTDLQALVDPAAGLQIINATAFNDAGQIVGWGRINNVEQGFLLTVPEPSGALLVLTGAALRRTRRMRSAAV